MLSSIIIVSNRFTKLVTPGEGGLPWLLILFLQLEHRKMQQVIYIHKKKKRDPFHLYRNALYEMATIWFFFFFNFLKCANIIYVIYMITVISVTTYTSTLCGFRSCVIRFYPKRSCVSLRVAHK
jgi:hypothetical protein